MNFVLYKTEDYKNFKKLKKRKVSFFNRDTDASVFLYNEQQNGLVHMILKLSDEYLLKTRLYPEYTSIPFDHYINVFFNYNKSVIFVEESLSYYLEIVVNFFEKNNSIKLTKKELSNDAFINITTKFSQNSKITKLEFYDYESDEDKILAFTSFNEFNAILKNKINIEYMSWKFDDFYASLNTNGKIKLDNSNDEFLIKWLSVFSNEIS